MGVRRLDLGEQAHVVLVGAAEQVIFPRASQMCTRMAIKIQLRRSLSEEPPTLQLVDLETQVRRHARTSMFMSDVHV